jgi:uncharacterized protein YfcZ (UPF0381/DUF406 family)
MAKVEDIKVGDYWLDNEGRPRRVSVVLETDGEVTIFVSHMPDQSLELFYSRQIKPELLVKKIEKTEATELFVAKIQEKIQEINEILMLDLKVTFSTEESAANKGGT